LAISSPETREKISLGVYASMEQRLVTMQTPEVQEKLRKPKSAEHNKKVSDAKKLWWANKKAGC
jgi:plasmid maintenance system killer protein